MDSTIRHARCQCGAHSVEVRGEPKTSMLCSCVDCRRRSGSAYNWSTYWDEADVTIMGETRGYDRESPEGRKLENRFCPICGTSLYWRADFAPGWIGVSGGALAGPALPVPKRAYWTDGRPEWATDLSSIPALERQ